MVKCRERAWHWSVTVLVVVMAVGMEGTPLSHQQQLRRRGIVRGRGITNVEDVQQETTEPAGEVAYTAAQLSVGEREKHLKAAEKAMKAREFELEKIKSAFLERERVLEDREYELDLRVTELDQRGRDIDKQVLETDKRLKEREGRIAGRERALSERESEVLKLAEQREQEIDRLSREREQSAVLREKALEDRERALDEREKKLEEREFRVLKRMEANRKRVQRRRELMQIEKRIGVSFGEDTVVQEQPRLKSKSKSSRALATAVASIVDQSTQASSNYPKQQRVVEKVTLRKVTSAAPEAVSEATTVYLDPYDDGGLTTSVLSADEQTQVTEAVAYESAKEYGVTGAPVKGEGEGENSIGGGGRLSGKKRKSGKRRARQRRQGHHKDAVEGHQNQERGNVRKHKVRKVVKRMGSDGTMVVISNSKI